VLPGSVASFKFNVTAPSTAGTYNFQWRMIKGTTWFGGYTTNVTVAVGSGGQTPPAAPSNLTATAASSSQINLSWADNSNNETGFSLERKTGVNGAWGEITTRGADVTSYSDTNLSASTTYYYRVRAYNGAGYSAFSNEAYATTSASGGGGCSQVTVLSGSGVYGYTEGTGTAAQWRAPASCCSVIIVVPGGKVLR
jgi:predicted phage tail protein